MAVSQSLRYQVLRRDGHACRYCGASAPEVKLTVDHVVPTALGGRDEPSNLVTACRACNSGKSATPPDAALVADVADDAVRWSAAIQAAADTMLADLEARDEARQAFDKKWTEWNYGTGASKYEVPRPSDWAQSVDAFIAAGLPVPVLLDCIETAMGNPKIKPDKVFRYACGIAWRKVSELHDSARRTITNPVTEQVRNTEADLNLANELLAMLSDRDREYAIERARDWARDEGLEGDDFPHIAITLGVHQLLMDHEQGRLRIRASFQAVYSLRKYLGHEQFVAWGAQILADPDRANIADLIRGWFGSAALGEEILPASEEDQH